MAAIIDAGYRPGKDFMISLDVAASEWKGDRKGHYRMPKKNVEMDTDQLISLWEDIVTNYPIFSIMKIHWMRKMGRLEKNNRCPWRQNPISWR